LERMSGVVEAAEVSVTSSFAWGEVVPMPTFPLLLLYWLVPDVVHVEFSTPLESERPVPVSEEKSEEPSVSAGTVSPPKKVEVAVEEVAMKYGAAMRLAYRPPEKEEVERFVTARLVAVVVPRYAALETESAVEEAYGNCDASVEEAKKAGAWMAVVVAFVVVAQSEEMVHAQPYVLQVGHVTAFVDSEYDKGPEKVVVAACRSA